MTKSQSFVEALAAYTEARADLARQLDDYTGSSPSYAFSYEINRRAELEKEADAALTELIAKAVRQALPEIAPHNPNTEPLMPTPDISNTNVARVLRETGDHLWSCGYLGRADKCRALADALDAQAVSQKPLWGALTEDDWKTREDAALNSFWDQHARTFSNSAALMYALRAAFPELAPADDRE